MSLGFGSSKKGKLHCVLMKKGEYGGFVVDIDLEQSEKKSIGYREDRVPKLFSG